MSSLDRAVSIACREAFRGLIAYILLDMGFDIATKISPFWGPPLMIAFVCITNILLITSLISLLTNSLTKVRVISHSICNPITAPTFWLLRNIVRNELVLFLKTSNTDFCLT